MYKKFKKYIKLNLIAFVTMLSFIIWKQFQFPDYSEAEIALQWMGRSYDIYGPGRRWVSDRQIGGSYSIFGFGLYSLKGDKKREYHMVVSVVEGSNLFVEEGYEIPEEGEITAVIAEYRLEPNGDNAWMNFERWNRFLKKDYLEEIIKEFQSEQEIRIFENDIDVTENEFYAIHVCFNGCPVAGGRLGFVGEIDGKGIFLYDEKGFLRSENTEDYKQLIVKGTEYFTVDSDEVMKEIGKLKALYKHQLKALYDYD